MSAKKSVMGRPKNPAARKIRVVVQINAQEKMRLDRLVALRQAEVATVDAALTISAQDVVRWLIAKELGAREAVGDP